MHNGVLLAATLLLCGGCAERHWPSGVAITRLTVEGQVVREEGGTSVALAASPLFRFKVSQRSSMAFSFRDDGVLLIAWVDGSLQLYVPSGSEYETRCVSSSAHAVAWSNAGDRFASVEASRGRLELVIRTENQTIESSVELWPESGRVRGTTVSLSWSPSDRQIAVAFDASDDPAEPPTVILIDSNTGATRRCDGLADAYFVSETSIVAEAQGPFASPAIYDVSTEVPGRIRNLAGRHVIAASARDGVILVGSYPLRLTVGEWIVSVYDSNGERIGVLPVNFSFQPLQVTRRRPSHSDFE